MRGLMPAHPITPSVPSLLWLLTVAPVSLLLSTAGHFLLDSRHCAFYPAAWWLFLHSKKSSWGLFWEGLTILSPALESGQVWLEQCSAEVNWGNPRQWIHPWGQEAMLAVQWNSPTSGPGWALVTASSDLLGCCPGFEHLSHMTSGTCCRPKTPLQVSGLRVRCPCLLPGTLDFLSWTLRSMSSIQSSQRSALTAPPVCTCKLHQNNSLCELRDHLLSHLSQALFFLTCY